MTKFSFQINGKVEFERLDSIDGVSNHLVKMLSVNYDHIDITGITVYKLPEKKENGGRKKRPYVRLADRDKQ